MLSLRVPSPREQAFLNTLTRRLSTSTSMLSLSDPSKPTEQAFLNTPTRKPSTRNAPARAPARSLSSPSPLRLSRNWAAGTGVVPREDDRELNERKPLAGGSTESEKLPAVLLRDLMPRHVAVIMDGNGRWAQQRGLPASAGHAAGVRPLRELVKLCCGWGIKVLTVFAFSSENWSRPKAEVDSLMSLFNRVIRSELENFMREGIQICIIGDSSKLPKSLQKLIDDSQKMTRSNNRLQLIVAVSYSGRNDIIQACKSIAHKVTDDLVKLEDITESLIEQELQTRCSEFPYPDLLIRTSGELRISNFLLWQLAYAELFFVEALWPDFGEAEFLEALISFQQRQRRYGVRCS